MLKIFYLLKDLHIHLQAGPGNNAPSKTRGAVDEMTGSHCPHASILNAKHTKLCRPVVSDFIQHLKWHTSMGPHTLPLC